jgi:hypothetical protein
MAPAIFSHIFLSLPRAQQHFLHCSLKPIMPLECSHGKLITWIMSMTMNFPVDTSNFSDWNVSNSFENKKYI